MHYYDSKSQTRQHKSTASSTTGGHAQNKIKSPVQSNIPSASLQARLRPNPESDRTQKPLVKQSKRQERLFPVQRKSDNTGIPLQMKERLENLSGFSFDDVRVHYNSDKPAQLQALAFTQGNHVYIGPGQEKHLTHELGHVVQQKRGEVKPTGRIGDVYINENIALEKEADAIGNKMTNAGVTAKPERIKEATSQKGVIQGFFTLNTTAYNLSYAGRGQDGNVANKFSQPQKDAFVGGSGRSAIVAHSISFSSISNLVQRLVNSTLSEANEYIDKCFANPAAALAKGFNDDIDTFDTFHLIFLDDDLNDVCLAVTNASNGLTKRISAAVKSYMRIVKSISISTRGTAHLPSAGVRRASLNTVLTATNELMVYLGTHINNLRIGFGDWNGILQESFDPTSYVVGANRFVLDNARDIHRLKKLFLLKERVRCLVLTNTDTGAKILCSSSNPMAPPTNYRTQYADIVHDAANDSYYVPF